LTIKVSAARLIAAIEAKRAAVVAEHAAKTKDEGKEFAAYRTEVLDKVAAFVFAVKTAKSAPDISSKLRYGRELNFPYAPCKTGKANTGKYDDALARLALVEDDLITLSEKGDAAFLDLV
jgi:hypothetical protein